MARKFGASFQRILWLPALALAFAVLCAWPMSAAKAQVIERGVQGGVVGAIIGGIVGGGRGAGTGAAIGAGVGLVTGAAEADANARAYYDSQYYGAPPPPPGGSDLVFNIQTSLARLAYDPGPPRWSLRPTHGRCDQSVPTRQPVACRRPALAQLLNIMISQGGWNRVLICPHHSVP